MSYSELSDSAPVLPSLVESKVSCSACSKPFELGQQVRDNFLYYNTGELKSIEHLHDPQCSVIDHDGADCCEYCSNLSAGTEG
jgi:hypothetical protein